MSILLVVAAVTGLVIALATVVEFAVPSVAARNWLRIARAVGRLAPRAVTLDGCTMPYLEGGRGEPLVLVHGFGADKDSFTPIAPFLTPHYRVIAPDLPGFGEATRDLTARYRIEDQVLRLHAFLGALGLRRVHLGGSSMGGFIVAAYAAAYPDEVASLWLLDAAGTRTAFRSAMMQTYRDTGYVPLLVRTPADYRTLLEVVTARPTVVPWSLRRTLTRRAIADFDLHTRILADIGSGSTTLEERYPGIPAPALIVWGREDRVLNPAAGAEMARLLPRGELIEMPGVGHLPMIERPRLTARDYLDFRARLQPPAQG